MSIASDPALDFDTRIRRIAVILYGVAIASVWLYANLPLHLPDLHRRALSLVTVPALLSLIVVWFFPWQRFHRNLFLTITGSALTLIALAIAASGGWRSPLVVVYPLVIVFNAAYYPRRLASLLDCLVVLSSLGPALYQPDIRSLVAYLVLFGPAFLCIGFVADLLMHEVRQRGQEVGALVTQRARDTQELARLAALHRAGIAVGAELDAQRVMETVVHELTVSLGYGFVGVYLREGDAQYLRAQVGFAVPLERIGFDEGVIGRVYRTGRGVLVEDVHADPDYLVTNPAVRSEVCVPVLGDGIVIGTINVESGDRLDRDDLEVLELFAQQIGAALANARLYRAAQEETEERRKSERDYRTLFERANDAIVILDPDDEVILDANTRACAMYGLSRDQLIGASLRDFSRDVARGERHLQTLVTDGQYDSFETVQLRADGTPLHLLINAAIIEFGGRRVISLALPWTFAGTGKRRELIASFVPVPPDLVVLYAEDITERKQAEEELHRHAYDDPLTGLPNRHAFTEILAASARRADAHPGQVFAVAFLDLDRFKSVNDSLGHHRGDRLLARVAGRFRKYAGPGVTVARFGGDEFALLLEGIGDTDDATAVAERFHAALRAPFRLGGLELRTTASVGIAIGGPASKVGDLLRDADTAMYRAKAGGPGRTAVFDAGMRAAVTRRLTLEAGMQRALESGEFRLVYQPIVALATGAITGFEALVRWEHPRLGLLMPGEFIPIAEETGLIVPLGAWILSEACRQLRTWRRGTPVGETLTIAVNLAAQQLAQSELIEHVKRMLAEMDLPPASLHLEITESALVADTEAALAMLTRLHRLGVGVHLDDFGMEYSSLDYLRRFPIDAIKIDQSFIRDLLASQRDRSGGAGNRDAGTYPGAACDGGGDRDVRTKGAPGDARMRSGAGLLLRATRAGR